MTRSKASLLYLSTLCIISITYFIFIPSNAQITSEGLRNWDAFWYETIVEKGYFFLPNRTCNLAFFPLFPLLWKTTGLGLIGISVLNSVIFFGSFSVLSRYLKFSASEYFFHLCTASFVFFALPYSESLFFCFGTLILVGYQKNNPILKNIGLLLISATRAVTVIFVPIIIVTEFFTIGKSLKDKIIDAVSNLLFSLLGMLVASAIQYHQTGKLFYFLGVQKFWRRSFVWPKFPFTTYQPDQVIVLDAIALVVGITAIYFLIKLAAGWFARKEVGSGYQAAELFSALYLAAVTVIDVFFTFHDGGKTNIWSLNRHLFATPFSILFLNLLMNQTHRPLRLNPESIFLIILAVFFITMTPRYLSMTLLYVGYFSLWFLLKKKASFSITFIASLPMLILQFYLFLHFLKGGWIG